MPPTKVCTFKRKHVVMKQKHIATKNQKHSDVHCGCCMSYQQYSEMLSTLSIQYADLVSYPEDYITHALALKTISQLFCILGKYNETLSHSIDIYRRFVQIVQENQLQLNKPNLQTIIPCACFALAHSLVESPDNIMTFGDFAGALCKHQQYTDKRKVSFQSPTANCHFFKCNLTLSTN
eukprot:561911-Rhodomonas_salina.3